MKIYEILSEDASAGSSSSAVMASVIFPMTPGTKEKDARAAVDQFGYGPNKGRKKNKVAGYGTMIRRIYPNEPNS